MSALQFRPFTKHDWFGFAGANPFEESEVDQEPQIAELTIDGAKGVVILDACGVGIYWTVDGCQCTAGQSYEGGAARWLVHCTGATTKQALEDEGFWVSVEHPNVGWDEAEAARQTMLENGIWP